MGDGGELATEAALRIDHLDIHSRSFIALSPFLCIGSGRPDGLADVVPRGGEPGFVHVLDHKRLAFPDRPGNNRHDTLPNIVQVPAVGLLFFIPGIEETLRINGIASVTTADDLMSRFAVDGKRPRSVVVVEVREVHLHRTKALKRADLWNPARYVPRKALPSFGAMLRDQAKTIVSAKVIDTPPKQDAKRNLY